MMVFMEVGPWRELKERFVKIRKRYDRATHKVDYSGIKPSCQKAGKAVFDMLAKDTNPFGFGEEFEAAPIAEQVAWSDNKFNDVEYYAEYWLCVLGFLARKDQIDVLKGKLRRTKIPYIRGEVCWQDIWHTDRTANLFFQDDVDYILEVCEGSIEACEKMQQTAPKDREQPTTQATRGEDGLTWAAKAVGQALDHPDWSVTRIAKEVGVARQTLYTDKKLAAALKARNQQKRPDKSHFPIGEKDSETGNIEAWR